MSEDDGRVDTSDTTRRRTRPARNVLVVIAVVAIIAFVTVVFLATRNPTSSKVGPVRTPPLRDAGTVPTTTLVPEAKIVVSPSERLHDGQVVTVTASGFDPGTKVMFMECLPLEINPNPPDQGGTGGDVGKGKPPANQYAELGQCRHPAQTGRFATPTTFVSPTDSAMATVDRNGHATGSMRVSNAPRYLSGVGWHGENIQYLLLGPVACTDGPPESPDASTTIPRSSAGPTRRGCQIVAMGRSQDFLTIRASAPLAFIDAPPPSTTLPRG